MNCQIMPRQTALFTAMLIFISLGMAGGMLNISWTYIHPEVGVDFSDLGILLLFATSGSLLAAFGSGILISRFGIGPIALVGGWWGLLVVTFVMYLGRGTLDAGMNNYVSQHHGTAQMNWLHASWGVGLTIAPLFMTLFITTINMGWEMGYFVMGVLSVALVALIALNLRRWETTDAPADDTSPTPSLPLTETLVQPAVQWSMLTFFVYGGVEIGTGQLANTLLVEGRSISQEVAGVWLSFYWGSFTLGRIMIGLLALRLKDDHILYGCVTLASLGAFLLVLADKLPFLNLLALICIGLGLSAIFPVLISQTPGRVGHKHTTNAIGLQVGIAGLGATILPGIIGLLTDHLSFEAISYSLLAIVLVLSVMLTALLRVYSETSNNDKHFQQNSVS